MRGKGQTRRPPRRLKIHRRRDMHAWVLMPILPCSDRSCSVCTAPVSVKEIVTLASASASVSARDRDRDHMLITAGLGAP